MIDRRHPWILRTTLTAAVAMAFGGGCDSSKSNAKPEAKTQTKTETNTETKANNEPDDKAAPNPATPQVAARPALAPSPGDRVDREDLEEEPEKEEVLPKQCKHPQATLAGTCKAKGSMPSCYSGMNGSRGVCDLYECRSGKLFRCDGVVVVEDEPGYVEDDDLKRSCSPTQSGDECTEIPI